MIRRISLIATLMLAGFIVMAPPALAQSAFLSGGASMRIEVEVYKGPLAKDIRSQIAEFHGLLRQTEDQFERLSRQIKLWADLNSPECLQNADPSAKDGNITKSLLLSRLAPEGEKSAKGKPPSPGEAYQCAFVLRVNAENAQLEKNLGQIRPDDLRTALDNLERHKAATATSEPGLSAAALIRGVATRAIAFARQISRSAQNWQELQTVADPGDAVLRAIITSYQFAAAEQANQIASRADALVQQIDGLDRRELPLSAFIAGSAPTDFARLFEWNETHSALSLQNQSMEDRVKILERLQADMHWARVNTVYASGRGDTSMAFIKDDIGNWSLKQFDNAPGELLQAYTGVAKAALSTATSLATGFASGGSTAGIKQLVGLADALSFGDNSAPDTARPTIDLQPARARLQARLDEIARLAAEQEALLKNGTPEQKKALRSAVESEIRSALVSYQSTLDLLEDATQPSAGAGLPSLPGNVPGNVPANVPGIGGMPQLPGR